MLIEDEADTMSMSMLDACKNQLSCFSHLLETENTDSQLN
jgi:hypothetical protein